MKKQLLLILFISILAKCLSAQVKIQGKVLDAESKSGIPYASVSIAGSAKSTSTNYYGEFFLAVDKLPVSIQITHISYDTREILVADAEELSVFLNLAKTTLSTVVVKYSGPTDLLKAAWQKGRDAMGMDYFAKAFYRQVTSIDDNASEIHELFYNLRWQPNQITGWQAKQSRYAKINPGLSMPVTNQSYLTFLFSGYLFHFGNASYPNKNSVRKDYLVRTEKYIDQAGQDIAVVSCRLKDKKRKRSSPFVDAVYYIGTEDHFIYKVESSVFNVPFTSGKMPGTLHSVAIFSKKDYAVPVLTYAATESQVFYLHQGRKYNIKVKSQISVYDKSEDLSNEQFNTTSEFVVDMNVIRKVPYSAAFWLNNPIVKRTPYEEQLISVMEQRSLFGITKE